MVHFEKRNDPPKVLLKPNRKAALEELANGEKINPQRYSKLYGPMSVRRQLKKDQKFLCAYCEKKLLDQKSDVEHYRPKSIYYNLSFEWDNLLLSCGMCNSCKGNQFPLKGGALPNPLNTKEEPLLLNPYRDDPEQYFGYNMGEIFALDTLSNTDYEKAEKTIDTVKLNRPDLKTKRKEEWMLFEKLLIIRKMTNSSSQENVIIHDIIQKYLLKNHEYGSMFRYQESTFNERQALKDKLSLHKENTMFSKNAI